MLTAAREAGGRFGYHVGRHRDLHLRFVDGSAVCVTQDTVVMADPAASPSRQARRFARILAAHEGWHCARDDVWPPPEPEAPGVVLAASPAAFSGLVSDRLRRAKLVMLVDDAGHRRQTLVRLRQLYGDAALQSPAGVGEHPEVILLIDPILARAVVSEPGRSVERVKALMLTHPGALALNLSASHAPSSLRLLADWVQEIEPVLRGENGSLGPVSDEEGKTADAAIEVEAGPSAEDSDTQARGPS